MVEPKKQPIRREPERRSPSNRSMLRLQRNKRQLIGFFLVLAVGGIIYYVASKPRELESGAWKPRPRAAENLDSPDVVSTDPNQDLGAFNLDPTSNDSQDSNDSQGSGSASADGDDFNTGLLKNGSTTDLIEELLRLRSFPGSDSMAITFSLLLRRSRIANRLLEMELSESQKIFATNELIENALQLDATNSSGKLGDTSARDNLIRIRDSFFDHELAALGAKASLAFPLIPLHTFFESDNESDLVAVADQFELHAEKILRDPATTARFVKLLVDLFHESGYQDSRILKLNIRVMERLEKSEDDKIKYVALALQEQIYFHEAELDSLVERIEGGNARARNHVQIFFEGLDANPSSRLEIYKIAGQVIEEYERLGHSEEAQALVKWLIEINKKNESKESREEVAQMCAKLSESPIDNARSEPASATP